MIPFTEYVHPETGRKHRMSWDRDRAKAKSDEFRQEAIDYFRKLDLERAKQVGLDVPEGATTLPTCRFNEDGSFVVDPIASSIKHSGAQVNDRWIPRWQEFCSKPQNADDAEYATVTHKPKADRVFVQPELPSQSLDEVKAGVKRGPGRPRKQVMANV